MPKAVDHMSAPGGPDRNKRPKAGEGVPGGPPIGGYGHGLPPYGQQPPHFQQAPIYGNQQQYPPMQYGGHLQYGQHSQPGPPPGYGTQPPPQMWGGQQPPGPQNVGMYRQGGGPPNGMTPDRAGYQYRAPPGTMQGGPPAPNRGRQGPPSQNGHVPGNTPPRGKISGPPPSKGPSGGGYWQGQQWPQHQWGGPGVPLPPAPHGWQGGPPMARPGQSPPPNMPQHMQPISGQKMWSSRQGNGMLSPGRPPRGSPDGMMGGYPSAMNGMPPDTMCKAVGMDGPGDLDMYMSRGPDDASSKSKMSQADKDKGRGSYRCGRCGVPKKGHICPYQPKLKRRPDEPPPVMRNAALQVEMDEFMTLRRLNIEIQGFPESYATAPYMADNMVVGEPHPLALASEPDILDVHPMEEREQQPDEMRSSPRGSPEMVDASN